MGGSISVREKFRYRDAHVSKLELPVQTQEEFQVRMMRAGGSPQHSHHQAQPLAHHLAEKEAYKNF